MRNSSFIYTKLSFNSRDLLGLLRRQNTGFYLESSLDNHNLGRFSFFGFDPFMTIQFKDGLITKCQNGAKKSYKGNIFGELKSLLKKYSLDQDGKKIDIPLLGGAVGFLSYDLGFCLEKIARKNPDDLKAPDLWLAFFDVVLCIDRHQDRVMVFSTGFPQTLPGARKKRANFRLKEFLYKLEALKNEERNIICPREYDLQSNFTRREYIQAVNRCKEHIVKGDIYQINLSQRFYTQTDLSCEQLYANLRSVFPVPFGGLLKTEDFSIVSGSPERFIKYDGEFVVTRPMKGTRPRSPNAALDRKFRQELKNSKKDQAELLMIVDLERNDLGRVCDYGTVKVESLRNFEEYSTVFQTTSQIKGRLYPEMDRVDIIKACFPGGSITGCPKIRAMQIIEELEPHRRGVYTGSLGYLSFNGNMDFNILIRSFFKQKKHIYFGVGGGVVYDSEPESEYQETLVKAEALKRALKGFRREGSIQPRRQPSLINK